MTRDHRSGMTLVEVLVALMVFAVIGVAAFAMLDQTLRSDRLTTGRLDRLVQMQRAMQVMALDTLQSVPGSLRAEPGGISFLRRGVMGNGVDGLAVAYHLAEGTLFRDIGPLGADPVQQTLLAGLTGAAWRYHTTGDQWLPSVPETGTDGLEVVLQFSAAQSLRRVFVLPQDRVGPPEN